MNNIYMPKEYKILKIDKLQQEEWLFLVDFDTPSSAGQFIQISLPLVGECPISITKTYDNNNIEFLIRKVGIVTKKLFELNVGDSFYLRGPFGNGFDINSYKDKNILVVSGGSGIAPVRPIINTFVGQKNFNLISGFRNQSGILFKDEIDMWKKTDSNIIITLDKNEDNNKEYKSGLVTEHIKSIVDNMDKKNSIFIIVGPPIMMHFACLELLGLGIKDEQIIVSFERNMSCAVGKCGHCKIDETYVCLEGPVFNYKKAKNLLD